MLGAPALFSRGGLGVGLAGVFDGAVARRPPGLLLGPRGQQLLMTCDIGGSLKTQAYETYSFLILDLDRTGGWLAAHNAFRAHVLAERRRIAFKALNDGHRRRALVPFLHLADNLGGVLVTFAVHKVDRPQIKLDDEIRAELETLWKPAVADRLAWVIYLSAFLISGFAAAGQDVMFIIDQDDVAANAGQLTELTQRFGEAVSRQGGPMMGHLRCGTTASDDGSFALEDLTAIPDLAAGAVAEFTDVLRRDGVGPLAKILQRMPPTMTWKTRQLVPWLLAKDARLTRYTCLIDGAPTSNKWRATILEWFAVEDPTRLAT